MDGAKVIRGRNKRPAFHCVIHQKALFSKGIGMNSTMNIAVKIIIKIRVGRNALTHRKCKDFLENLNSEYGGLLLYTEVRHTINQYFYFFLIFPVYDSQKLS